MDKVHYMAKGRHRLLAEEQSDMVTMDGVVPTSWDGPGAEIEWGAIRHMAYHDPLTGLPNRLLLNGRLEMAVDDARRCGTSLALLFLDLDRFKSVNDSLGHAVGDQLLLTVAARLQGVIGVEGTAFRLGGDEFVLLLPGVRQKAEAGVKAKGVLNALKVPFNIEGYWLRITASIGIGLYPWDGEAADILLKNADKAMYDAKGRGGDGYRHYQGIAFIGPSGLGARGLNLERRGGEGLRCKG